jgi:RNA polymerase sigma-70 factor, ECF subfamily
MPGGQAADDSRLLRDAKNGSAEAFGNIYERYAAIVFRFLFAHLDDRMDAEDMTEEVFIKAWQALPRFHDRGLPFSAFLLRIARNSLTDHFRRCSPQGDTPFYGNMLVDPQPQPFDQIAGSWEHHHLRLKLHALREDYRTVLVARFVSNLTPEETARMMGRSPGAVRVLQHRALTALRKSMNGWSDEEITT